MSSKILLAVATCLLPATTVCRFLPSSNCTAQQLSPSQTQTIQSAFSSLRVVPDLIPCINPSISVGVRFGSAEVDLGNFLLPNETTAADQPVFSIPPTPKLDNQETNYTVMILDANNPESWKIPTLAYLGFNFRPSCNVSAAAAPKLPAPWAYPLHPLGDSPHRYVTLVFLQTREPHIQIASGLNGRYSYPLAAVVQGNGLKLIGGNFFREAGVGNGTSS